MWFFKANKKINNNNNKNMKMTCYTCHFNCQHWKWVQKKKRSLENKTTTNTLHAKQKKKQFEKSLSSWGNGEGLGVLVLGSLPLKEMTHFC